MKISKTLFVIPILLILMLLFQNTHLTRAEEIKETQVLMIDISLSMEGQGDGNGRVIFPEIKNYAKTIIDRINLGSKLYIYQFDKTIKAESLNTTIQNQNDKIKAKKYIDLIKAEGVETYLAESYKSVILKVKDSVIKKEISRDSLIKVMVFTDGRGNGPNDKDINEFVKINKMVTPDCPNLYTSFIAVGDIFTPIEIKNLEKNNIKVTQGPTPPEPPKVAAPVTITEKSINTNKYDSKFEVIFSYDKSKISKEELIKAKLEITNSELYGLKVTLLPELFSLTEKQIFNLEFSDKNLLNQLEKNEIFDILGKITFTPIYSDSSVVFDEENVINLKLDIRSNAIVLIWNIQKEEDLFKLKVNITANFLPAKSIFMRMKLTNTIKEIEYDIDPKEFDWNGEPSKEFTIKISNQESFEKYVKEIKEEISYKLTAELENPNSEITIENRSFSFEEKIQPIPKKPFNHFFWVIPSFILLLIVTLSRKKKAKVKLNKGLINCMTSKENWFELERNQKDLKVGLTKNVDILIDNIPDMTKGVFFILIIEKNEVTLCVADKHFKVFCNKNPVSSSIDLKNNDLIDVIDNNNHEINLKFIDKGGSS